MQAKFSDQATTAYLENYRLLRRDVKKYLKKFIALPKGKNVHDLRGSFRRLNAAISVLPGNVRNNKSLKKYVEKDKRILKLTSPVRDIDIVGGKLKHNDSDLFSKKLLVLLKTKRRDAIKKPLREARKLSKRTVPIIKNMSMVGLDRSIEMKISIVRKEIENYLRSATSSDENLDELHSLRKAIKKLRYILELLPDTRSRKREISRLANWQDISGDILEDHVFETYLKSLDPTEFSEVSILETRESWKAKYRLILGWQENLDSLDKPL